MTVSNASAFKDDTKAHDAVKQALSQLVGVPAGYITLTVKLVQGRRLDEGAAGLRNRRLAESVIVDYAITLPATSAASASVSTNMTSAAVSSKIEALSTTNITSAVQTELNKDASLRVSYSDLAVTSKSETTTAEINYTGPTTTTVNMSGILDALVQTDVGTRPLVSQVALFLTLYLVS
jgi:hypothetical protein